jgi:hypothetical protein
MIQLFPVSVDPESACYWPIYPVPWKRLNRYVDMCGNENTLSADRFDDSFIRRLGGIKIPFQKRGLVSSFH